MDFIGCKAKINPWIYSIVSKSIGGRRCMFIDGCSGSGSTSRYFLTCGFDVIANDLLHFSSSMTEGFVLNYSKSPAAQKYIDEINKLNGKRGFFYDSYSARAGRPYFTDSNAQRIDACREFISTIDDPQIKQYLLYCGLEALSRVSNTTGVQAAFLKHFKERATQQFKLRREISIDVPNRVATYTIDIVELVKKLQTSDSILYIDPPFNARQFGPNYHLYETFTRYDKPELIGKTGLRKNWKTESGSTLCNKVGLFDTLREIIIYSQSNPIYLSYSSDGIASIRDILNALDAEITIYTRRGQRYKSDTNPERKYNFNPLFDLLFEIKKTSRTFK